MLCLILYQCVQQAQSIGRRYTEGSYIFKQTLLASHQFARPCDIYTVLIVDGALYIYLHTRDYVTIGSLCMRIVPQFAVELNTYD